MFRNVGAASFDNFWPGALFPRWQIPHLSAFPSFADTLFSGQTRANFRFRLIRFSALRVFCVYVLARFLREVALFSDTSVKPVPRGEKVRFAAFYMYVSANDPLLNLHKSQHTIGLLFEAPPAPPKESRFSPAQTASALAILWGEGGFPERNTYISHWRQTQITDVPCFFADLEGGHLRTRTYKVVSLGCFF